ncbi:probable polyamine oxidase 5 [Solanum dulcamara]|uniref:probable polyamine oxidase 5 n=1 Tax=Solanum dulcamara TaxID=45834 RepID=UPI0024850D58|nr:probable polyamine oxidase 5 [Solanum dulcamara]XP_055824945.1 probable polyamine oxidase 5 [Solanum dulcamara]
MVSKKAKVVIIGAGMAGLTAANKLYTTAGSKELLDVCVVEGGNRIGGRINTSEFGGERIEMGATWIHGIGGSPIYKIARDINSLQSDQPWECMDGLLETEQLTIAEDGYVLNPSLVDTIYNLFNKLMDIAQGKLLIEDEIPKSMSIGSFLRKGLDAYWDSDIHELKGLDKRSLEQGIFSMFENIQRTYTSANDLQMLDYSAEKEYRMFPGEEITIARGYLSVIQSLASVLPPGLIQLGRKVTKVEWQPDESLEIENGANNKPAVKLHFLDGSIMYADHVIVTVSLGVLKQGIHKDSGMFNPPLASFKTQAISRLGFGVVNKVFLKLTPTHDGIMFPHLQMVFHQSEPNPKVPWWMRRTANLSPIYGKSNVLISWFVGKEALEVESLGDKEIIDGFSKTISSFLINSHSDAGSSFKVEKVLKSQWGTDPLFLGSYSYVAVGSSGDDLDAMAEPLPKTTTIHSNISPPPLQILFAGEATHRTHYSTTHGAYFSGLREANRLLHHYHCIDI